MILWIFLAAMTGAAIAAVLVPVARRNRGKTGGGSDAAVYRDQLSEVDRDLARGVIDDREAEAARIEISRRLLAASGPGTGESGGAALPLRPVLAGIALLVPAFALGVYLTLGSPGLTGQPLAARIEENPADSRLAELILRVEEHLRANPDDGRGWEVVAPVYTTLGRLDEAVAAYRSTIRLLGPTSKRHADLGEALVQQAGGVITAAAETAFTAAVQGPAPSVKAQFYLAQGAEQEGDLEKAQSLWTTLLQASTPADAWYDDVAGRLDRIKIARGEAPAPGPTQEQVRAADAMSPADRQVMIETMVTGLNDRLAEDGGTADEWVRLIRSFMVLNRPSDAETALQRARNNLSADADGLARLNATAGSLGLGG